MSRIASPQVQSVTTLASPPPRKSLLLSALLTLLVGPLGMLYTTFLGFLVMSVLFTVVGVLTLGHGLPVIWPLWGVWAGHRYNERQRSLYALRGW
ncbi:hypothetical protein [Gephyromycinifex aptenodytis]|uniref:hypothetical protein n=1 Tax=Gephyromycinifex aptenodytis TaxID=2716227 RepID=UPI001448223D|nr:hypothetical protein [Gephyromycinifex aptenodytis]